MNCGVDVAVDRDASNDSICSKAALSSMVLMMMVGCDSNFRRCAVAEAKGGVAGASVEMGADAGDIKGGVGGKTENPEATEASKEIECAEDTDGIEDKTASGAGLEDWRFLISSTTRAKA